MTYRDQIKFSDIFEFKNGKKRPENNGKYNVYGSSGLIGTSSEKNTEGSISVIGRVGSKCGNVFFIKEPSYVSDNAIIAKTKKEFDSRYGYYLLKSKKLNRLSHGSGQPLINQDILNSLDTPLLTKQEEIFCAETLSQLDQKIELNQKMNKTLEEIGKTLFKSWFTDFDPVRAKVEKRPTGLSKEISDLFPDSFEDSELGDVPKGWNIKKINDIFEVKKGSTPATKNTEFWEPKEHIWVSPRDLSQNPYIYLFHSARGISEVGLQKTMSGLLPDNTVMMSSRAPIGLLGISGTSVALGTGIFAIPPKKNMSSGLTYFFVDDQIRKLKQLSIGTTFEEVSLKIFNNLMIVFPNDEILIGTKDIFDNLFKKIKNNTSEIKSLTNIRDTLLPKLISGELKITNAANLVEEAGI